MRKSTEGDISIQDVTPGRYSVIVPARVPDDTEHCDVSVEWIGIAPRPLEPWTERKSGESWQLRLSSALSEKYFAVQIAYSDLWDDGPYLNAVLQTVTAVTTRHELLHYQSGSRTGIS